MPGPGGPSPRRGRLFVLSGPSAVGKSTLQARIRQAMPSLWYSISATTRAPRRGEKDGVDYFFVSRERFAELVATGRMLEHAEFAGHRYGTPRDPVREKLAAGRNVLLEIDVQGARQVRQAMGREAVLIFLAPPSFEELARRLVGRGTESASATAARLAAAREELAAQGEFDHVVVNTDLDAATAALLSLLVGPRASAAQ